MMASVQVEAVAVPGCPHVSAAVALARSVLDELNLAVPVSLNQVQTLTEARRRGFIGSPTILIDGHDPFAAPGQASALACRVYPARSGWSPLPDRRALRRAMLDAQ
jgi:hypothetical protein